MRELSSDTFLQITGDLKRTGGMDMSNYHLASYVARMGFDLHVVAHYVEPSLLVHPNLTWHRVKRPRGSNFVGEKLLRYRGNKVAQQLKFKRPRIVVNGGNCPLAGVNWVHYVHSASSPQLVAGTIRKTANLIKHRIFRSDEAQAFRMADVLVANSKRTQKDLEAHSGIPRKEIRQIYYGTDRGVFYPPDPQTKENLRNKLGFLKDKFLFVFIGALGDRRKGFDTLLQAWQAMAPEFHARAHLLVVGSGAELEAWKRRAAEGRGGGSVGFLGFRTDVPEILRACDVFVAPTRYEAFGLAAQEAVCCGLPVIISIGAGVTERLGRDLEALFLRDCESASELSERLLVSVTNPALPNAARQVSAELLAYSWDDMASQMLALFTDPPEAACLA